VQAGDNRLEMNLPALQRRRHGECPRFLFQGCARFGHGPARDCTPHLKSPTCIRRREYTSRPFGLKRPYGMLVTQSAARAPLPERARRPPWTLCTAPGPWVLACLHIQQACQHHAQPRCWHLTHPFRTWHRAALDAVIAGGRRPWLETKGLLIQRGSVPVLLQMRCKDMRICLPASSTRSAIGGSCLIHAKTTNGEGLLPSCAGHPCCPIVSVSRGLGASDR